MAEIKVGDPVLFFGKTLSVAALATVDGVELAEVADMDARKARDEARAKILELRERQAALKGDAHEAIAAEIRELDAAAMEALLTVKLRRDLLTWWEERGIWISEGRILSDAQMAKFIALTGDKPRPGSHRNALKIVEALGGE